MIYVEILLTAIAVILLIPVLVLFVQILLACLPKARIKDISANNFNIAVLIPAHNESTGIIDTLNSIKPQLKPSDRLLVVADNCTDDTAEISTENGAEVIKRNDAENRGKGFALDFGVRYLAKNPPDIVVIIDADCLIQENALNHIAVCALGHDRPVQALYLMYAKGSDLKSKIAEFAWCVKNLVRPLGYAKLGLPCQLMGTGMAFAWDMIAKADLANGNIVEDMKLGIELCKSGKSPIFYADALVTSYFPLATDAQTGQRARWEHGHLAMILSEVPKLLVQGITKLDKSMLAMAFDLSVPPLALLVAVLFGYAAVTGIAVMLLDVSPLAFQLTLFAIVLLTLAVVLAWRGWGRKIITFSTLLTVPVYVVSKIPHYIKFMFNKQKTWNKTERD